MSAQLADFLKDNRKVNQLDASSIGFTAALDVDAKNEVDIDEAAEEGFKTEFTRLVSARSIECILASNHAASSDVLRFDPKEIGVPKIFREKDKGVDSWCDYMNDMTVLKPKAIATHKKRNPDGNVKESRARNLRNSFIDVTEGLKKFSQSSDQLIRGRDYLSSRTSKRSRLQKTQGINHDDVDVSSIDEATDENDLADSRSQNSETSGEDESSPVDSNFTLEDDVLAVIMNYTPT
ncbi:hypothetical protein SARC_04520, partial [Sphaeroforma arctica JP610]